TDGGNSNAITLDNGVVLTLGSGITFNGNSGTIGGSSLVPPAGTLINNGVIQAVQSFGTFNLNSGATSIGFVNNGILQALHGGTLSINNTNISGSGTITTDGSSTVTQNAETISTNTIGGLLNYTNSPANALLNDTVTASGIVQGLAAEDRVSGGL